MDLLGRNGLAAPEGSPHAAIMVASTLRTRARALWLAGGTPHDASAAPQFVKIEVPCPPFQPAKNKRSTSQLAVENVAGSGHG